METEFQFYKMKGSRNWLHNNEYTVGPQIIIQFSSMSFHYNVDEILTIRT